MLLHDAVGVTCKKAATTEIQGAGVKYMGYKGCMLDNCVFVIRLDMTIPLFGGGRTSWSIILFKRVQPSPWSSSRLVDHMSMEQKPLYSLYDQVFRVV